MLFQQERLTFRQASQLAKMDELEFLDLLESRQIPAPYDVDDLKDDLATLKRLGQL